MALALSAMLEEVAMRRDWQEECVERMNEEFAEFRVTPNYNIMVTLAGRSYVFCSDAEGKLQVSVPEPGIPARNAFTKAQARVVFEPDAFEIHDAKKATATIWDATKREDWVNDMFLKRKLRFEGDTVQLENFDSDVHYEVNAIQSKVDAAGPGKEAIKEAQTQASDKLQQQEEERLRKVEAFLESSNEHESESLIKYDAPIEKTEDMAKREYFEMPLKIRLAIAALVDKSNNKKWEEMDWFQRLALAQKCAPTANTDAWQPEPEISYAPEFLALPENLNHYDSPPEMGLWGMIVWSAMTTMFGNMGQANYSAANIFMDSLVFNARIGCKPGFMPISIMQGMVVGLGMRAKAFGSQDFALADPTTAALQLDHIEEGMAMQIVFKGNAPEWVSIGCLDQQTLAFFSQGPVRDPDPWRKGKGGGLSLDSKDSGHGGRQNFQQGSGGNLRLFPGCRVEICGLVKAPQMNGVRCTLMEEMGEGKWQVRLDGSQGDKVLKVEHMKQFNEERDNNKCASDISMKEFCLAGTWCDWMPQDMRWDSETGCHLLDVEIDRAHCPAGFDVATGKAGARQWRSRKSQWTLKESGKYQIQLFCKSGGRLDRVECKRMGPLNV